MSMETTPREPALDKLLEQHRVQLTGYCYRMLGSAFEAEDAVQETLVRAWKSYDQFQGRASLRSWLYRIATNVCLTMVGARQRRARPMDLGPSMSAETALGAALDEATWLSPVPDSWVVEGDALQQLQSRETVRLAFVNALQLLPAKQRAALILAEVLQWSASEVADLLGSSVASVNSALQRARATIAEQKPDQSATVEPTDDKQRALLGQYLQAFEAWDVEKLVALLHKDAVLSMPPFALWLQGPAEVRKFWYGPGAKCAGSKMIPVTANGLPGFAQYKPRDDGKLHAWALHILEIVDEQIVGHNSFLDTPRLFPLFGLPLEHEA
jgi:RNA polymerase sigma-70 factor (ECF subfamily)